jgi:hypothetical protein
MIAPIAIGGGYHPDLPFESRRFRLYSFIQFRLDDGIGMT